MGKRGPILIAIAAVAVLAVLAWAFVLTPSSAPDPIYQGKPLSYWLRGYGFNYTATNRPNHRDAQTAVMVAGTNAVPLLLRMLGAQDSPVKTKFLHWVYRYAYFREHFQTSGEQNTEALNGFAILGGRASGAVPGLIKMLDESHGEVRATYAMIIFSYIGPAAHEAVPSLLRTVASTNESIRAAALAALGQIHANPEVVVPVLIRALHDSSAVTRVDAAAGLGAYRGDASPAVPDLIAITHEPDGGSNSVPATPATLSVRAAAEYALRQIEPETHAPVVPNSVQAPIPYR
jgi:hypothetical protein